MYAQRTLLKHYLVHLFPHYPKDADWNWGPHSLLILPTKEPLQLHKASLIVWGNNQHKLNGEKTISQREPEMGQCRSKWWIVSSTPPHIKQQVWELPSPFLQHVNTPPAVLMASKATHPRNRLVPKLLTKESDMLWIIYFLWL